MAAGVVLWLAALVGFLLLALHAPEDTTPQHADAGAAQAATRI
ncbi:MAG TPA: hypothetical protein VF416_07540 [Marmoricola sp.]|jgi:hypothetical protein